jgi:hypothetical protein
VPGLFRVLSDYPDFVEPEILNATLGAYINLQLALTGPFVWLGYVCDYDLHASP